MNDELQTSFAPIHARLEALEAKVTDLAKALTEHDRRLGHGPPVNPRTRLCPMRGTLDATETGCGFSAGHTGPHSWEVRSRDY